MHLFFLFIPHNQKQAESHNLARNRKVLNSQHLLQLMRKLTVVLSPVHIYRKTKISVTLEPV